MAVVLHWCIRNGSGNVYKTPYITAITSHKPGLWQIGCVTIFCGCCDGKIMEIMSCPQWWYRPIDTFNWLRYCDIVPTNLEYKAIYIIHLNQHMNIFSQGNTPLFSPEYAKLLIMVFQTLNHQQNSWYCVEGSFKCKFFVEKFCIIYQISQKFVRKSPGNGMVLNIWQSNT